MEVREERRGMSELNRGANSVLLTTCSLLSCEALAHPPLCVSVCPPSPSLQHSLSSHRQGRSFSVSAHIPLGQHYLESTDTELIERAKGSSFFRALLKGFTGLSPVRGRDKQFEKAILTTPLKTSYSTIDETGCVGF